MPHDGTTDPSGAAPSLTTIQRTLPADFRWVRRAIHEIEDDLLAWGLDQADVGSVSIILAEALNNVVEHAYDDGVAGKMHIAIRLRGQSLIFELRDDGRPMPNGRPPAGTHPVHETGSLDTLPEGGFGWLLIRELVRDLVYDRTDGQNILIFRYCLGD